MTLGRKNDCIILTETPLKLNYLNFPKIRKNAQAYKYSKKGQSTNNQIQHLHKQKPYNNRYGLQLWFLLP